MRFAVLSALLVVARCGYPVAQGSYPTPPDSYAKASYPTAPAAYASKPVYDQRQNSVPPPPPPPNPAHYSSDSDVSVSVQSAPPATDSTLPSAPTFGGSVSSGTIAGGSALNYNAAAPAYRLRAKARARARARTVQNRRFQRRPLQPIRRFHKKAKH